MRDMIEEFQSSASAYNSTIRPMLAFNLRPPSIDYQKAMDYAQFK